jgi:hypothetical protein
VAVEHAEEVRREVDGAALVRLRRLDAAQVDGALDLERAGAEVGRIFLAGGLWEAFAENS